jgi:TRAP-type mannitol/chloroaromatic compound transport system substrate-binding protein
VSGTLEPRTTGTFQTKDPLTRKVYDSYISFLTGIMDWDELSETGYRKTRRLALE